MSVFVGEKGVHVGLDGSAGGVVPEGDGADIVVVPVVIELLDIVLAGEILGVAGVVELEDAHAADQEGLDGGLVAGVGHAVGLTGKLQLAGLVVELFGEQEDVLVEVQFLLPELGADHVAVALGHLDLPLALAPVQDRYRQSDRHNLLVADVVVGHGQLAVHSGVADGHVQVHLVPLALGCGHIVVGLEFAAQDILGK